MNQVYDCLADEQIAVKQNKVDADKICTDHGGNARGYYVFPVADTVDQVKREVKVGNMELFDSL